MCTQTSPTRACSSWKGGRLNGDAVAGHGYSPGHLPEQLLGQLLGQTLEHPLGQLQYKLLERLRAGKLVTAKDGSERESQSPTSGDDCPHAKRQTATASTNGVTSGLRVIAESSRCLLGSSGVRERPDRLGAGSMPAMQEAKGRLVVPARAERLSHHHTPSPAAGLEACTASKARAWAAEPRPEPSLPAPSPLPRRAGLRSACCAVLTPSEAS